MQSRHLIGMNVYLLLERVVSAKDDCGLDDRLWISGFLELVSIVHYLVVSRLSRILSDPLCSSLVFFSLP